MITDDNDKLMINDKSHKLLFFFYVLYHQIYGSNIVELYSKYISFFKERNYQRF